MMSASRRAVWLWLAVCACTVQPGPGPGPSPAPSAIGGATSTGGSSGIGGQPSVDAFVRCTTALASSPEIQNMARQELVTVADLVSRICNEPAIVEAY